MTRVFEGSLSSPTCVAALCATLLASGCTGPQPVVNPASPRRNAAPYASPRMGSGGYGYDSGSAWPGAEVPSGMMRVGPDTTGPYGAISFLHFSGYYAGDNTVLAFSHMHLHGTGAQDYGVVGILPLPALIPGQLSADSYQPTYHSANETAYPGYYALTLDNGIKAEFTTTTHAALERYTFPAASSSGTILIDLAHHLQENGIASTTLTLTPEQNAVQGTVQTTGGLSGGFTLYFAMRFNTAWTGQQIWSGDGQTGSGTTASGKGAGTALTFDVSGGAPVEVQVGLSLVSAAGAAANLSAEMTTFDFDTVRAAAVAAWNQRLGAIKVYTNPGMDAQVSTFYSAFHHAFVMPGVYSDADGQFTYSGQTQTASGFHFLTDISGWDVHRTLTPLYDLVAPDLAADLCESMYAMAAIGTNFPKWPLATSDAGCMIGSPADTILAEAYLKGISFPNVANAYQRLRDAALDETMPPGEGRGGRGDDQSYTQDYMPLGYVAAPHSVAVSLTCELNQGDYSLSNFATALGNQADATALLARSTGYQKLSDPTSGFLRWKTMTGQIPDDSFDPEDFSLSTEYDEADAYQSELCATWDPTGLASLAGGKAQFATVFEQLFENSEAEHEADAAAAAAAPSDQDPNTYSLNLPTKYYFAGNEPDIHYVYLAAQLGRPDLTQKWVPWLRETFYSAAPDGLPGNDDGGTMSAWYVLSALGIYPIIGSDQYVIGSPEFPRADIQVRGGIFSIYANGVSSTNIYVQSATLNGEPLNSAIIHHSDLKAGGSLVLEMGPKASTWGQ